MRLNPTVCAVGKDYQIMIMAEEEALYSIRIGEKVYYYHTNGIRISTPGMHRIIIPQSVLDEAREYTVIEEIMIERTPYFPKTKEPVEKTYKFVPLTKTENINIYHLADVHGEKEKAINAVGLFGERPDILVMNGDISSTSNTFEDMTLCYEIASAVTKGEFPCVISRGNHDLRGPGAQELEKNMPGKYGKSYYTFRIGSIWGILIDVGEDKNDFNVEYGQVISCHPFRLEQDEWIKDVIDNAKNEYEEDGVEHRIVISHIPFTFKKRLSVFDIERELYSEWARLIKENIKPSFMLCGHTHNACISEPGSEKDDLGNPCTVIVGADVKRDENTKMVSYAGCLITLNKHNADVIFNTENEIIERNTIKF